MMLVLLLGFYISLTIIYEPLLALLRKLFGRNGYNRAISFFCMLIALLGAVQIVLSTAFIDVLFEYVIKLFPKALECEGGALTIEVIPDAE